MVNTETYTEYRLEWTYPYLAERGETNFAYGQTKEMARWSAQDDDGYYWAGRDIAWSKREVTVTTTEWEAEDE